jgi:hypothetical protein
MPTRLCTAAALAVALLLSPVAGAQEGTESPGIGEQDDGDERRIVTVELKVVKRLRRTPRGLKGQLRIRLTNGGTVPVELIDPEVHGLVFAGEDGGELAVVLHPCQCVRDARHPDQARRIALAPGEFHEGTLEEFGCSGSAWKAPPPGRYSLTYRIHDEASALAATARDDDEDATIKEALDRCKARLESPDFWLSAYTSDAVPVRLR